MEIVNICSDICFDSDRLHIIQKYLVPLLISGELKVSDINTELLSDVFNVLELEQVEKLKDQLIVYTGNFDVENECDQELENEYTEELGNEYAQQFVETKWKINSCYNCDTITHLTKCKNEHIEECAYGEITDPEGCKNAFCDDCIFHVCAHENPECLAIRCAECSQE